MEMELTCDQLFNCCVQLRCSPVDKAAQLMVVRQGLEAGKTMVPRRHNSGVLDWRRVMSLAIL
jgi:hypothetical protein